MTWAPKIVSGVQSVIGIGSKLMGGLQALWGVILANPIVLIVAAIAAAVAAFIYFWNTSEEFRQFWINLWEAIKSAVQAVVQAIATFFTQTIPDCCISCHLQVMIKLTVIDCLDRLMTWNPCGVEYSAFRVSLLN